MTVECPHDNRLGFPGMIPATEMALYGYPPVHWWCPDCGTLFWFKEYKVNRPEECHCEAAAGQEFTHHGRVTKGSWHLATCPLYEAPAPATTTEAKK